MLVNATVGRKLPTLFRHDTGAFPRPPPSDSALTTIVPFELVDAVLEQTRSVQRRLRALPSRVGIYFLLAMCLFPEVGYKLVRDKMTTALTGIPVVSPTAKALRDLRRRVGSVPLRGLLDVLSGPLARPSTPGVRFGPYRNVSFDGCSSLKVPDTECNRARFGASDRNGYPMVCPTFFGVGFLDPGIT